MEEKGDMGWVQVMYGQSGRVEMRERLIWIGVNRLAGVWVKGGKGRVR